MKIGNECNMDENCIFSADFMLELPNGFQKRLTFNVTNRSPHFNNGNSGFFICKVPVKPAFDFVCNMGNDLYSPSTVITTAFFLQDGPVDLSGSYIGVFIETFINKTFIVSQIQVSFRTIIGYEYFAVLYWIHCPGVYIDIRIKFLHGDFITAGF